MPLPRASRVSLGRARAFRRTLTDAEVRLWVELRRKSLGVRFRRQHPIGPYIADFANVPFKIIIEVDGATHGSDAEVKHDSSRDAYLERRGWMVLRFTNDDVYRDIEGVIDHVARAVRDAREFEVRRSRAEG